MKILKMTKESKMKKKLLGLLILTHFIACIQGCVSRGTSFAFDSKNIKVKETNKDEVLRIIGNPTSIAYINGQETFHYKNIKFLFLLYYVNIYEIKDLYITFAEYKKVSSYTYYTNNNKEKQKFTER